jgi:histidine triad (HIT) family protein
MSDCIFCKIVSGDIPSKKVYADDRLFAFEDIQPQAPTHILIVPRQHLADLHEAARDPGLLGELVARSSAIARDRGITDYRLVSNTGPEAGQAVFHLHFHLLAGRRMRWPPG